MIYQVHMANDEIVAYRSEEDTSSSPSFRARIKARSKREAIYLYVVELERRSKEQPTLVSLTQKLADRNTYLEQAIVSHLATIEQIRAVVRSECSCKLKERMIEP